jgi:hypothetical protein
LPHARQGPKLTGLETNKTLQDPLIPNI